MRTRSISALLGLLFAAGVYVPVVAWSNGNVYVSRFWHNHQPIYWPEWNGNGGETERVQFAWDSIVLKGGQTYGTGVGHPDNNLTDIFGLDDRRNSYQSRPRDALAGINSAGGFAISYSGSLMDNVRNLGNNNQLGYYSGWWNGNREASEWYTPSGSRRLDLVGFTYHHSLGSVLPKEVFRKEIQIFKQGWWKAWNKNADLSDHSKGFFPTEMAFTPTMIDVLVDEGYEWVIVASHHLSRTCPTYFDYANPTGSYNIYSSPPNRADLLGPSPTTGWWYGEPNPGNAAWNVSPYAYQLHKSKYVNPETGAEKTIIMVPSDDVMSYRYGYANEGIGKIQTFISPFASDPSRPVIVMPSSDGDNAWGGGFSSWLEATPQYFGESAGAGYNVTTPQDFVNAHGAAAPVAHVEDGAWIFPESGYGSPYFLKWIEPPLNPTNLPLCYPGTKVDLETPGFALKFWSWAAVIAGANWCETAEQILEDEAGTVEAWKIQAPYDWDGSYTSPNVVERAWHIYLCGLDSGFNYYGGLGNDDEVKQTLATRRAVEMLEGYMSTRMASDTTPPTVFKPQRFPWNPGGYTFGWFNSLPGGGTNSAYLKKMESEFYIWTHAFDINGITNMTLKVRIDGDGVNTMANNQNETYAGGGDVGGWIEVPMTMRELPDTQAELNAAADNGQIDYFIVPPTNGLADYYFAKITDASVANFRGKLLDYYIEAYDGLGNMSKSDIQHVFVEDDGKGSSLIPSEASFSSDPRDCAPLTVTYEANDGVLSNTVPVEVQISFDSGSTWSNRTMTHQGGGTSTYTVAEVPNDAPSVIVWFQNVGGSIIDSNGGNNWSSTVRDCEAPVGPSSVTFSNAVACSPVTVSFYPNAGVLQTVTQVYMHLGYDGWTYVFPTQAMAQVSNNLWRLSVVPPNDVSQIDLVFNDGSNTWDNNGGLDWHYALNVCSSPVTPPGITITNPPADLEVGNEIPQYTLEGQVGAGVVGLMIWSNELNGAWGQLSAISPWSIASIPLAVGTNCITITGTNAGPFGAISNAFDSGASTIYQDGWATNENGGFGFGPWKIYQSSMDSGENGRFMANSAAVDIGEPAWGLYANSGNLSEAKRCLTNALQVGQTLGVKLDHGFIDNGSGVGVALQNDAGDTLWQFFFNGGDTNYNITGSSSDIEWSPDGFMIEVTLTGPTSYLSRITPFGDLVTRTNTGHLASQANSTVTVFRAWNFNAGTGSDYDVFFNDLKLTSPDAASVSTSTTIKITRLSAIADTDGDGLPDSWELKHFGTITGGVASADSDGDGSDNTSEYTYDTIPTNSASVFSNEVARIAGWDIMQLTIPGPTTNSRVYDIWYCTNLLEGTWQSLGLGVQGALNGSMLNLQVTNNAGLRYYSTGVSLP